MVLVGEGGWKEGRELLRAAGIAYAEEQRWETDFQYC